MGWKLIRWQNSYTREVEFKIANRFLAAAHISWGIGFTAFLFSIYAAFAHFFWLVIICLFVGCTGLLFSNKAHKVYQLWDKRARS